MIFPTISRLDRPLEPRFFFLLYRADQQTTGNGTVKKLELALPGDPKTIGGLWIGKKNPNPPPRKTMAKDSPKSPIKLGDCTFFGKSFSIRKITQQKSRVSLRLEIGKVPFHHGDTVA